jgi:hypothetical protein
MVTQRSDKYLCLMLETAESLAVYNTVSITLEGGSYWARFFVSQSALGELTFYGIWGKTFFSFFT